MIVTKSENIIWVDVDDTLVLHKVSEYEYIYVTDPLGGQDIKVTPHTAMIRLLKEEKARGAHIIVHSRGGWQWALNVVEALSLQQFVDEVKTKALVYFDDKPVDEWLRYRVYLEPNIPYKNK
jgi:hypothetical protein